MRILFVYRGYGEDRSNSAIDRQRDSLAREGVEIDKFPIESGGIKEYLKAIWQLNVFLKKNHYDAVHAHYGFCGFAAKLATHKPVVCSLMGSDVLRQGKVLFAFAEFFCKYLWNVTIVKSQEMKKLLPKSVLIANGVDLLNFRDLFKKEALIKTGFNLSKRNIIFIAKDPHAAVKNLMLARNAIRLLNNPNIELHLVSGKSFSELPFYYSAADLLLLTSLSEGSPNVIKEAMACNCPIVSTDVGDVKEVFGGVEGCYLTNFELSDVAQKIQKALNFCEVQGRTHGRERIITLGLDSKTIAEKIFKVYQMVLEPK